MAVTFRCKSAGDQRVPRSEFFIMPSASETFRVAEPQRVRSDELFIVLAVEVNRLSLKLKVNETDYADYLSFVTLRRGNNLDQRDR